jgi:hypothetical protein
MMMSGSVFGSGARCGVGCGSVSGSVSGVVVGASATVPPRVALTHLAGIYPRSAGPLCGSRAARRMRWAASRAGLGSRAGHRRTCSQLQCSRADRLPPSRHPDGSESTEVGRRLPYTTKEPGMSRSDHPHRHGPLRDAKSTTDEARVPPELHCALCGAPLRGSSQMYRLISPFVSAGKVTVCRTCRRAAVREGYRAA